MYCKRVPTSSQTASYNVFMNEIKISAGGVTYRLTDTNNGNKYSRAKTEAGEGASIEKILAYYDKLEGSIHDKNHEKVKNGPFWAAEKARMEDEKNQLKYKSEDELENIVRRGENMDIPGSLFQLAKLELELRDRKNRNNPGPKIGILNTGKNNTFIDNTFANLDVGIQDEGEGTLAKGNKFFSSISKQGVDWAMWGVIVAILSIVIAVLLDVF